MGNLDKLQAIASGGRPTVTALTTSDMTSSFVRGQSDVLRTQLQDTYPTDPQRVFDEWIKGTKDYRFNSETVGHYWETYDDLFPGTPEESKQTVRDNITQQLGTRVFNIDKEHFLRDQVGKLPTWAQDEYGPVLGVLSQRSAEDNLFKASAAYRNELVDSLGRFDLLQTLDPDVSEEVHVADAMRLVEHDALEVSQVVDGRLAVTSSRGDLLPAYDIQSRAQIFGSDDPLGEPTLNEVGMVNRIAPDVVRNMVRRKLAVSRGDVKEANLFSEHIIGQLLEEGKIPRSEYGKAITSIGNQPTGLSISKAAVGLVNSGEVSSREDIEPELFRLLNELGDTYAQTS